MTSLDLANLDIHSKEEYVRRGYPWQEWDRLRKEAPVFWYERDGIEPFWAITRHADILTVSKRDDVFVNSQRLRLQLKTEDDLQFGWTRARAEARGWDPDEAVRRVEAAPERAVFLALLDQRNLAGLGNEYVNELLFVLGLHPERPVGTVRDVRRLLGRGRQMLDVNKDRVERTFTGNTRPGRERWVYGRERGRCRRCGTPIRAGRLGDQPTTERNTFWCPSCQPLA